MHSAMVRLLVSMGWSAKAAAKKAREIRQERKARGCKKYTRVEMMVKAHNNMVSRW